MCDLCGGTGVCALCDGAGYTPDLDPGTGDREDCDVCFGDGLCANCAGRPPQLDTTNHNGTNNSGARERVAEEAGT